MGTGRTGRRGVARGMREFALAVPVALAVVVGCTGPGGRNAPPESVASKIWFNRHGDDDYHNPDADAATGLALVLQGAAPNRPADKPMNVVCVSGGGKYAAFTAGVLCGWTATGTRPTFDVATGVSSGAPVALMAYLGPKYDPVLAELFLTLRRSDLYVWRPVRGIVTGSGLMSSRPLERLLEERINDAVLADIRAAHESGRRLFIATSNELTHRLVVWDVGAIATSGRPDAGSLVRKVLLAACSIPGLVPAVQFDVTVNGVRYTELHADAGNLTQVFARTVGPLPAGSDVWVLSAGKTHPNAANGAPRVLEAMVTAVSGSLYALFRADTMKLDAWCGVTHSRFHLLAIPSTFSGHTSSMVFDPAESERLYLVGSQMAAGAAWQTRPPDTTPGEVPPPRTGVDFAAPD